MRVSAQTRSHKLQASAMVLVSFPMICSVVSNLRTVTCVKRQKKNCSSSASSNQSLALSECMCRLQSRASHTFESRKFNMFIDLFVGQVDLGAVGGDQRELHSLGTWALALQQHSFHSR
jgi:hypothetical protein